MGLFDKLFGEKTENSRLQWKTLNSLEGLQSAIERSYQVPVVLFKHSTRCSISAVAKSRLERDWDFEQSQSPDIYYLDLIAYRAVSNAIAEQLSVYHESPQLILVKNGEVVYDASHSDIRVEELKEQLISFGP